MSESRMTTSDKIAEGFLVSEFLQVISEMFERPDYLLPLAAGQRQFRQDNYQMASAAMLEDLFFDTLGMYLRENHPTKSWTRRTGKELWDYAYCGLEFSHKETLSRGLSVWWTAGDRGSDGRYSPKRGKETYTSPHPVVLVYSGAESVAYEIVDGSGAAVRSGTLLGTLGCRVTARPGSRGGSHTIVLAETLAPNVLRVDQVWTPDEWKSKTFVDLWPQLGGQGIGTRDLWVDRYYTDKTRGLASVRRMSEGVLLNLDRGVIQPGIYVLSTEELVDVPMIANNRAHSAAPDFVDSAMRTAAAQGRFLSFPLWFAQFADAAPPNLYIRQKEQYDKIFAARQRG